MKKILLSILTLALLSLTTACASSPTSTETYGGTDLYFAGATTDMRLTLFGNGRYTLSVVRGQEYEYGDWYVRQADHQVCVQPDTSSEWTCGGAFTGEGDLKVYAGQFRGEEEWEHVHLD